MEKNATKSQISDCKIYEMRQSHKSSLFDKKKDTILLQKITTEEKL